MVLHTSYCVEGQQTTAYKPNLTHCLFLSVKTDPPSHPFIYVLLSGYNYIDHLAHKAQDIYSSPLQNSLPTPVLRHICYHYSSVDLEESVRSLDFKAFNQLFTILVSTDDLLVQ